MIDREIHLKDLAFDPFTNRPGVARIETSILYDARPRHEFSMFNSAAARESCFRSRKVFEHRPLAAKRR